MVYGLRYGNLGSEVGCGEIIIKLKNMYDITQSAVLLEGEISEPFNIGQGVVQGCSMSPILFSISINQFFLRCSESI